MLSEKNFRKFIIVLTLITLAVVFLSTFRYYRSLPVLGQSRSKDEQSAFMPCKPFDMFSIDKDELKIRLGDGKEGSGEDYDHMYIDYNQSWFGFDVKSRYYYGDYNRVYQIILSYDISKAQDVYVNMKKVLGKPIYDEYIDNGVVGEYGEDMAFWMKDSVRYTVAKYKDEKLCEVTMNIQYYSNPAKFKLGERPIAIQTMPGVKLGDSEYEGNLVLVGDKPEYLSRMYSKLFLVYGTPKNVYFANFKFGNNGGLYPQMTVKDIDGDGQNEVIVKAENEYITYYTVFKFVNSDINAVYSGEENPETSKKSLEELIKSQAKEEEKING